MMFGRKLKALRAENAFLFEAVRNKNSEIGKAEKLLLLLPKDTPGLADWFSRNGSRAVEKPKDSKPDTA